MRALVTPKLLCMALDCTLAASLAFRCGKLVLTDRLRNGSKPERPVEQRKSGAFWEGKGGGEALNRQLILASKDDVVLRIS